MALLEWEKKLLTVVLEVAGDNEELIEAGIIKALRGVNEPATRRHLWCVLPPAARDKIHRARQKHLTHA